MYQYRMLRNFRTMWFTIAGAIVAVLASTVFGQAIAPPDMKKKPAKPAAAEPQAARFETSDGVKIQADYYPAPVKEGEKAPVAILIHMYPADRSSWKPLVPGLDEAGFAVLAYDIRGHGGSTEPADKKLKESYDKRDSKLFADAWKDVEAAKGWLGKQPGCDVSRMALVGASVGCSIALDYAARDEAVKAVVCLSPGTKYMGVDSIAHIKKCGKRAILLISPEGEYKAVEELIKASDGAAKGEKHPGGEKEHGTGMFKTDYGKTVRENIVAFVADALGMKKTPKEEEKEPKPEPATKPTTGPTTPTVAFIPLCRASNSEGEKKYTIEMAKQLAAAFGEDPRVRVIEHKSVEEAATKAKLPGFLVASNKDIIALVTQLPQGCDVVVMLGPNASTDSGGFQVSAARAQQILSSPRYFAFEGLLGPPKGEAKVGEQEVETVRRVIEQASKP